MSKSREELGKKTLAARPIPNSLFSLAVLFILFGCSERGSLSFAETTPSATTHTLWVANFRSDIEATNGPAPPRPEAMKFEAMEVSVPPNHEVGNIEWPDDEPDPNTDFVVSGQEPFRELSGFASAVARADKSSRDETVIFVHGYNTRHAEAVYQLAQFVHDFEVPTPSVLFSWPSAGVSAGYVYDRDSALLARDQLEELLVTLSQGKRKIILIGHSMGSYLIMETLRQISFKDSLNIATEIDALVLMAPDIDGELFRDQATSIGQLPDPFILMVAEQDRALRISSLLTGLRPRLGSQTDRAVVGDLPISVVDVSSLSTGAEFDHKIATTSPAAIAIIKQLSAEVPPGEVHLGELVVLSDVVP